MAKGKNLFISGGVNLPQAIQLIKSVGPDTALLFTGEPGIGKSAMHYLLKEEDKKSEYHHVYFDCTNTDPADIFMRIPNRDSASLDFMLTSLIPRDGKPVILMLDEIGKGTRMLRQAAARIFHERVVGDYTLPKGSIVFATTNNTNDGVGDVMEAHQTNRLCMVRFKKPTVAAWCAHASDMNIDAMLRTWVQLNPKCLDSYQELSKEELDQNEFIFNPSKKSLHFVSPRSLAKCDPIVKARKMLGDTVTQLALAGTAGAAFAQNFMTFQDFEKDVYTPEQIVADPTKLRVPDNDGALWHMVNKAVDFIKTQDHMSAYVKYVSRFPRAEHQGIFFSMVITSTKTKSIAEKNIEITRWAVNNFDLFM